MIPTAPLYTVQLLPKSERSKSSTTIKGVGVRPGAVGESPPQPVATSTARRPGTRVASLRPRHERHIAHIFGILIIARHPCFLSPAYTGAQRSGISRAHETDEVLVHTRLYASGLTEPLSVLRCGAPDGFLYIESVLATDTPDTRDPRHGTSWVGRLRWTDPMPRARREV